MKGGEEESEEITRKSGRKEKGGDLREGEREETDFREIKLR